MLATMLLVSLLLLSPVSSDAGAQLSIWDIILNRGSKVALEPDFVSTRETIAQILGKFH